MWSALEGSLLLWALLLGGADRRRGALLPSPGRRRRGRLGDGRALRGRRVLHVPDVRAGRPLPAQRGARSCRGPGPTRCSRTTRSSPMHPPLLYAGFVGFTRALRLRHRHAHHRTGPRPLAARAASLDGARLGRAVGGHRARRVVELPGARLGRLLGMGPGGERRAAAVADARRPTSTRSSSRTGAGSFGCGTSRSRSRPSR